MKRRINLHQKVLSRIIVALLALTLFSGFGWLNSMVSYEYEVQDDVYDKKPLNQHQKDILFDIIFSKAALIGFTTLLIFMSFLYVAQPSFGELINYSTDDKKA